MTDVIEKVLDRAPGDITIFPENQLEASAPAAVEEDDYVTEIFEDPAPAGAPEAVSWKVAWAATDRLSPCYQHLLPDGGDNLTIDKSFELGRAEFELLLRANRYAPKGHYDVVAFGIRGARLRGQDKYEYADRIFLEDSRPNHVNFNCVIGYFFRKLGKFSAYTASTVPWHEYMSAGRLQYNLLPTGCYIYKKGAHRPQTQSRWVEPALRLSDAEGSDSGLATVLRTSRDAVFDFNDEWSLSRPSDNIHCAYSNGRFSSLGCQTIKGPMTGGHWADFQSVIGTLPAAARVDYVLITGAEASIAWSMLRSSAPLSEPDVQRRLGRLRVGSEGVEVARLQAALGVPQTAYFGPETKKKLTETQKSHGLPVDGIYAPVTDAKLQWSVFSEPGVRATIVTAALTEATGTTVPAGTPPRSDAQPSAYPTSAALTLDQLRKVAPRPSDAKKAAIWDRYAAALTGVEGAKVLAAYEINSPRRFAFILANMLAETGGLSLVWESMNYSAARLLTIFGRAANISPEEAHRLAQNPEAIGERVYGLGNPRKARDLGNTKAGDGFRYRGGGFLQTTGRYNYRTLGERIGINLEDQPELVEDALVSLKAACAEWHRGGLNSYADNGSFRACCNGINYGNPKRNGAPIGFDDRLRYLRTTLKALGLPPPVRAPGALENTQSGALCLELGDIGPDVEALQDHLSTLGYDPGDDSGAFTTKTRDAVLEFQARNELPTTGAADTATLRALESADATPKETEAAAPRRSSPSVESARPPSKGAGGSLFAALAVALAVLGLAVTLSAAGLLGPAAAELAARLATQITLTSWLSLGGWIVALAAGLLALFAKT